MNENYTKALDKIRDEMAANHDHPGIQFLGGWLTGQLEQNQEIAERILNEKKTVKAAFAEIYSYASKHKTGNFAFVPPEKALEIVGEFYGIDIPAEKEPQALVQTPVEKKKPAFDLDALLGGL